MIVGQTSVVLLFAVNAFVSSACTSAASPAATPTSVAAGPVQNQGQSTPAAVPALQILSPKDGETITLPSAVRFEVTGFTLAREGAHIAAFIRGVADGPVVALDSSDQTGLAYLPSNKLLTGKRDLTFALAKADGTLLENPEARVTVSGLTIQGGR
jgi:hypothetical protein